jgi:hypothetical protein
LLIKRPRSAGATLRQVELKQSLAALTAALTSLSSAEWTEQMISSVAGLMVSISGPLPGTNSLLIKSWV